MIEGLLLVLVMGVLIFAGLAEEGKKKELGEAPEQAFKKRMREIETKEYWQTYRNHLDGWVQQNRAVHLPLKLSWGQLKILVACSQHIEFYERPQLWQLLEVWGYDGTPASRLKFDYEFEQLRSKRLVFASGGCNHLPEEKRRWALNTEGRDLLIKENFI